MWVADHILEEEAAADRMLAGTHSHLVIKHFHNKALMPHIEEPGGRPGEHLVASNSQGHSYSHSCRGLGAVHSWWEACKAWATAALMGAPGRNLEAVEAAILELHLR